MVDSSLGGRFCENYVYEVSHEDLARMEKASETELSQRQRDEPDLTEHIRDSREIGSVIDINSEVLLLSFHFVRHVPLLQGSAGFATLLSGAKDFALLSNADTTKWLEELENQSPLLSWRDTSLERCFRLCNLLLRDARQRKKDRSRGWACNSVHNPDGCDELGQVLLHVDEIRFMHRCNARLEDVSADEFTNCHGGRAIVGRCKVAEDGSNDARDDTAASGVTHAKCVGAEEHDGLKDFG